MSDAPLQVHAPARILLVTGMSGAGKTTAVAPALLAEAWCTGQIILTSPRRVAARAAAERMAELLGERAGETVGYLTRPYVVYRSRDARLGTRPARRGWERVGTPPR